MKLLLYLMVGSALAAPPDPVVSGEDLVAWWDLQEQSDPAAWRAFLLEYPDSPLAERAWRRLVEVGHAPDPATNPTLKRIANSYEQHEAELARTPEGFAVATLRLDEPAHAVPQRHSRLRGGFFSLRAPAVLTSRGSAHTMGWMVIEEPLLEDAALQEVPTR